MIEISAEHLIPIRSVPHRLPPRDNGRCVHISAVYRWVQRGVRGVHLKAVRIGGVLYTSKEALQQFVEQLNRGLEPPRLTSRSDRQLRELQLDQVHRGLQQRLGIKPEEQAETGPPAEP